MSRLTRLAMHYMPINQDNHSSHDITFENPELVVNEQYTHALTRGLTVRVDQRTDCVRSEPMARLVMDWKTIAACPWERQHSLSLS